MRTHSTPSRTRRPLVLAACAVLALGVAACGDDDDDPVSAGGDTTTTTAAASSGGSASPDDYDTGTTAEAGGAGESPTGSSVKAEDFSFSSATVAPGADVSFENKDDAPHTMTADDGAFDTGTVESGDSASVTAPADPGDYAFHCEIHPQMTGTLTVEA